MPTRPSLSDGTTTVQFIKCSGQLQPFQESNVDLTRPGVNGVAFRTEGQRTEATEFEALRDVSSGEAATIKANVAKLKSKLVMFVDDFGVSHTEVFVKDVKLVMDKAIGGATGGIATGAARLLGWKIMLQDTKLPT